MTLVVQPVQEAYFYKEIRKTPASATEYPGYPIYHLHRRITDATSVRVNEIEYWQPLPLTDSFKEYTPGDENVEASRVRYEQRLEMSVRPRRRYYSDRFPVYTHKYFGVKLFVATNKTKIYPLSPETNPYSYRNIQIWVESSETYENTFDEYGNLIVPSYWYHPFENVFYPFGNLNTFDFTDTQFFIDSLFGRDISGTSDDALLANTIESIRLAQIRDLVSQGRSRENAVALVNANSQAALSTISAQSLIAPSATTATLSSNRNQTISVTVRSLSGGVSRSSVVPISSSQNPSITQTTTSGQPQLTYEFKHRPNQISYTNLGSDWVPIDRAANRPMIEWKSYKLMSVSFSFIVAPDLAGSLDEVIDGKVITTSIDNDLKILRQMASSPFPVEFRGFDKLLEEPVRYPFNNDAGKGSLFVIADFNVTSIHRSSTGAISRASCDMTLTEYPKELIKLIEFPKLIPIPEIPPPPPGDKPPCDGTLPSSTWNRGPLDINALRQLAKYNIIKLNEACQSVIILNPDAYDRATRGVTRGGGLNLIDNVPWSELLTQ